MSEERLMNIETKIAFQEDMIDALNKTIYQQQLQIDLLEAQCKAMAQHIQLLAEAGSEGRMPTEKPPHY
jgi:SlyX protein